MGCYVLISWRSRRSKRRTGSPLAGNAHYAAHEPVVGADGYGSERDPSTDAAALAAWFSVERTGNEDGYPARYGQAPLERQSGGNIRALLVELMK